MSHLILATGLLLALAGIRAWRRDSASWPVAWEPVNWTD